VTVAFLTRGVAGFIVSVVSIVSSSLSKDRIKLYALCAHVQKGVSEFIRDKKSDIMLATLKYSVKSLHCKFSKSSLLVISDFNLALSFLS